MHVSWPGGEQSWSLDRDRLRLGRAPDNDIVIPFPVVSRHHAVLERRADGYWCIDHQSRHGLLVNGRRVPEAQLRAAATVRIGDGQERSVSLRYEAGGVPAASWAVGREIQLGTRPRWRIGRDPHNDIVLTDEQVSAWHAEVLRGTTGYMVADLGSTNGTFVNQRQVDRQHLAPGDVIQFGGTLLRFDGQAMSIGAPTGIANPVAAAPGTQVLRLRTNQRTVTIGRDPTVDLCLDHPMISRHHARVIRQDGEHVLEDLGSTNGTFLNGRRLAGRALLQRGDRIQIGPFKIAYNGEDVSVAPVRGGLRLDGVSLVRKVKTKEGLLTILDDVTISVMPGEFVSLVGGSGAGKSTLLKALNGFEPANGEVMLNGEELYRHFDAYRHDIGYVPQTDIIHRDLSVAAALGYVAELRLPPDTDRLEREQRIDEVLALANISGCRDKLVSKLSGGQLKRVSTAVELLASPRVLFLDEPTSGLDPGLDKHMMHTFRDLAEDGRTVVLVTHATANIGECDKVAFLGYGGRLVYYGPPTNAVSYFQQHATSLDGQAIGDFADIYSTVSEESAAVRWEALFRKSDEYQRHIADRMNELTAGLQAELPDAAPRPRSVGPLRQFRILTRRYLALLLRDRRNLAILLAQAPIIGGLLMLTAEPQAFESGNLSANLKAQTVVNAMAIVAVWFGVSNAAREITKELAIYTRERMANLGILPYVSSKVAVLTGLCVVQTLILLSMVLFRTGIPDEGLIFGPVVDMYVTLLLTAMAGVATGLLLSSLVANEDRAMSMTPIILVPQMLLSGVMFKLVGWKVILSWVTLSYWATHALGSVVDICGLLEKECRDGGRINLEYEHTANALLTDWAVLAGYAVLFLALTVVAMRRKDVLR